MKKNKVTFKTTKQKGKWGWLYPPSHSIKLNGKLVGSIGDDFPHRIYLMKIKDDPMEDGNKNCKWMWITLKKESETLQKAKDFITENINEILTKHNIYQSED